MITEPKIENREEQNYAAIKTSVTQQEIPLKLPPLMAEIYLWLDKKNIKPSGPPFFRYIKMSPNQLDVEVGIPVASAVTGDDNINPGKFEPGKYISVTYFGHYMNLPQVYNKLENWAKQKNIKTIVGPTEFYPVDPETEPNPDKWQTIITSRLAED